MVQADLDHALEEKPEGMTDHQWMYLKKRACSVIRGYLVDVALYSILEEKTSKGLWLKLHTMYMKKKYVQQADVEEETVQPSDAGRWRCLGSHLEI